MAEPATWLERFRRCHEAVLRVATELASEGGGPLTSSVQRANDPEVWRGAIADQFTGVIGSLERALDPVVDHLEWLLKELSAAEREADAALRTEAVGLAVPAGFDPVALATRLRAIRPPDPPSFFGWQAPLARASGFVGLSPDAARALAAELRRSAAEVRRLPGVLQEPFAPLGLEVPSTFQVVAQETDAVAEEIIRRVRVFETADGEVARGFQALNVMAASRAATLKPLDPDDAFGSAVRRVLPTWPPPVAAMPGAQPTQAKEADPVSTSTGNYFLHVVDLVQPARGLPTVFARTYNSSRAAVDGPLGVGWSHSFGTRLTVEESGATVEWGDGRQEHHRRSGARFIAPTGAHDVLRETSVGYEVPTKAKIAHRFDGDGRLLTISDPSGNATVLLRDNAGALTAVLDASGIETVLERDAVGRITAVVGVLDRRWTYAYDPGGLLVAVTHPEGGQTTYGYDGSRRLTTMIDPEGRLVVRNRYDDEGPLSNRRTVLARRGATPTNRASRSSSIRSATPACSDSTSSTEPRQSPMRPAE